MTNPHTKSGHLRIRTGRRRERRARADSLPGSVRMNGAGPVGTMEFMATSRSTDVMHVVIAGGGVAGLEAALALHDLAGERVEIDLVAPHLSFVYHPLAILEPFENRETDRFALSDILKDRNVHHRLDSVTWVDRSSREAHTRSGLSIRYDALLLCPGPQAQPIYPRAITIFGVSDGSQLRGVVADIDTGAVGRIAFVVPPAPSWELPLYELALLSAARARERGLALSLAIFSPASAPLGGFGKRVGTSTCALLADAGIELECGALCRVPERHSLLVSRVDSQRGPRSRQARYEQALEFDRILALPRLNGPRIRGVPTISDGFIPVDTHGRILGTHVEFAAGDATNCPVKHGSVAAQQADAAAQTIAAMAGASVTPAPCHPVARGILLTGETNRRLSASIVGGHTVRSEYSTAPDTADKIDATHLSPRLAALRTTDAPHRNP